MSILCIRIHHHFLVFFPFSSFLLTHHLTYSRERKRIEFETLQNRHILLKQTNECLKAENAQIRQAMSVVKKGGMRLITLARTSASLSASSNNVRSLSSATATNIDLSNFGTQSTLPKNPTAHSSQESALVKREEQENYQQQEQQEQQPLRLAQPQLQHNNALVSALLNLQHQQPQPHPLDAFYKLSADLRRLRQRAEQQEAEMASSPSKKQKIKLSS